MKLLLTGAFHYDSAQLERLGALGFETVFVQDERQPLTIDVADINAVVCNALFMHNDIERFKSLQYIQLTSAGTDRVPVDYIFANGIQLHTARGVYSAPMAEWVVLKILEIYKKSRAFYEAQQKQQWIKQRDLQELTGKKAAIIGYGSVGAEVARRLKAFDVHITAVDVTEPGPAQKQWIDALAHPGTMSTILSESDIVILTLPLTEETRHLFDEKMIAAMKDHSVLINIARGGVIKEEALIAALKAGKFLGIALDVFEHEPLPENSPLWHFENALLTPHNAFVSEKVRERLFEVMFRNLAALPRPTPDP